MKWVLLGSVLLIFLILIIIITKITITLQLNHSQDDDHIKIKFKIWFGLVKYTINIPLVKIDNNTASIVMKREAQPGGNPKSKNGTKREKITASKILNGIQDTKMVIKHVIGLHTIIRIFMRKVKVKKLEWKTIFGIGDASLTGILTGVAWSVKSSAVGLISQYMRLETEPIIMVTPAFQQTFSQTHLTCIIQFRIGHAIVAAIRLVKYWKGSIPNFSTDPLSKLSQMKKKN